MKHNYLLILTAIMASQGTPAPAITPAEIDRLVPALIAVESRGNEQAAGDGGRAIGCLQIWPDYVKDVNRIAGTRYSLADRLDRRKSIEITRIYLMHYGRGRTIEQTARIHNGGPTGYRKAATVKYWRKVKIELDRL